MGVLLLDPCPLIGLLAFVALGEGRMSDVEAQRLHALMTKGSTASL
jgi:hypothetical protein